MILESNSGLVVLVLPNISQFFVIMSLSGGLFGSWVISYGGISSHTVVRER